MAEVNAIDALKKNQYVDATDDGADQEELKVEEIMIETEENIFAAVDLATTATSPIAKTATPKQETKADSDKSIMKFENQQKDISDYPDLTLSSTKISNDEHKLKKLLRDAFIEDIKDFVEAEVSTKTVEDAQKKDKKSEQTHNHKVHKKLKLSEVGAIKGIDLSKAMAVGEDAMRSIGVESKEFQNSYSKHMMMQETIQDCVNIPVQKLGELKILLDAIDDYDEKVAVGAAFWEETRIEVAVPELKEKFEQMIKEGKLTPQEAHEQIIKFAKTMSYMRDVATKIQSDPKNKEVVFKTSVEDLENMIKDLMEMAKDMIPEDADEETAKEYFKAFASYGEVSKKFIIDSLEMHQFSTDFKKSILDLTNNILAKSREFIKKFVEEFFETEKGQIIKKQAKYAIQEVKEAKKEFLECKEKTEKATEEAQAAKAASEKAIQEAKEEQHKAEAIAEKFGFRDLDMQSLYKVVKQESPRQANNLLYAQASKKKAYWAEYDANVAQHHAEFLEGLAKKHFQFAQMKVAAAFAKMQAMMSVQR